MKSHILTIIIASAVLMFFPFLSLSEFWEYLFVVIPAFVIAYSGIWLLRNIQRILGDNNSDSLSDYIADLKSKFNEIKTHKKESHHEPERKHSSSDGIYSA